MGALNCAGYNRPVTCANRVPIPLDTWWRILRIETKEINLDAVRGSPGKRGDPSSAVGYDTQLLGKVDFRNHHPIVFSIPSH